MVINSVWINANVVGSLIYADGCIWPDLAFEMGILGRCKNNLDLGHCRAAKEILWCLQGTKNYILTYHHIDNLEIMGYSNPNFSVYMDTRKLTSGCIFLCAEGIISRRSTMQNLIALYAMGA